MRAVYQPTTSNELNAEKPIVVYGLVQGIEYPFRLDAGDAIDLAGQLAEAVLRMPPPAKMWL